MTSSAPRAKARVPAVREARPTWRRALRIAVGVVQGAIVVAAVAAVVAAAVPYFDRALEPKPPRLPATMAEVHWEDPGSSSYCLACHKKVSPALGVLDVERGHSQNVKLNETQLAALAELGTLAGPGDTLICMSCHKLGQAQRTPYMLADTLADSRLCQRCHPGHYARGTPHDLRQTAPDETNRLGHTVAEGGPCSACHLAHSYAREIHRSPLDPDGLCITCHQEYGVASGHARTRAMEHPESHCRECHDPHDAVHGEFLRKPATQLCLECHSAYAGGLAAGMHPLGPMDRDVPQVLLDAGAQTMGDPRQLTCVVCHSTHEAGHASLLHIEPDSNRLCLACHEDKLLANTHDGVLPRHGQLPVVNEAQRSAVAGWGNPVGPNGELLCVSCHRVHGGVANSALLSFSPTYGDTCVACHPAQGEVFGTTHDLRVNYPTSRNSAGLTPIEAGACSACHLAHQFPRPRVPAAADPGGQCLSCHAEGGLAQRAPVHGVPHPETNCRDCHDPHTRQVRAFLRTEEPQLCGSCHEEELKLLGGPHDRARRPDDWPADAGAGVCLACHVPHGGAREDLLRLAGGNATGGPDDACLACHADADWNASSAIAAIHPQSIAAEHASAALSLVPTDAQGNLRMGCRTCHDPHGGATPANLARVAAGEPSEALCLKCHEEKRLIRLTRHAPQVLAEAGYATDSCKPCHAMHESPDAAWGDVLSPRFLLAYCEQNADLQGDCVPCLACHHEGTAAPVRAVDRHPEVVAMNLFEPNDPGYMPLFTEEGQIDAQGGIACRTCHLSHGRVDLLRRVEANEQLTPDERQSVRMQVRPFKPPNVCTSCHGAEARLKYLFFHDPRRRGIDVPE